MKNEQKLNAKEKMMRRVQRRIESRSDHIINWKWLESERYNEQCQNVSHVVSSIIFLINLLSATCIILMDGEESDHREQP